VHESAARILNSNLALLPPATRLVLERGLVESQTVDVAGPAGRPAIRLQDGRTVQIHAANDPAAAAEATVARLVASGPLAHLIVIGAGLGYLFDALERSGAATKVLAVEPVPAIAHAMLARRDWTTWLESGRLRLLVGPDYAGAADAWRVFGSGAPKPPTIMSPLIDREFPEEAARARGVVAHILAGVQANEEARRKFAGRYLLNSLANLPAIAAEGDAAALSGAFAGVPAFVVGAGPSLDANLPMLARLRGRALIVAVDTAVRPLLAAGLQPDLVVAVDPSDLNALHLKGLPDVHSMWFVAEGSLDPGVWAPFSERTFTFRVSDHEPWPWLIGLGAGRAKLRAWGSVLTTAFDLACEAGCDPIVFAGADLAFSRGLQYCRNTTYESSWAAFPTDAARAEQFKHYLKTQPHQLLPDVHGQDVVTTPNFVQFRDWIVSRAGELEGRRVMNATGAGILHGGSILKVNGGTLALTGPSVEFSPAARLAAAWGAGIADRARAGERLLTELENPDTLPVAAWLKFGGDTASAGDIGERIQSAVHTFRHAVGTAAHLDRERARYDAAAATPDGARTLVHPDYDFARRQAASQQAHTLLDYLQRTFAIRTRGTAMDTIRAASPDGVTLRVLDFGCGLGRAMEPLVEAGHHVDGVDISSRMITLASSNPRLAGSRFFFGRGSDCGDAIQGAYDLATSLHAFHRIRPRSIRLAILRSLARVLRPGGVVAIQLPFFSSHRAADVPAPHVAWSADVLDEPASTDGEVWPTADQLPVILEDFSRYFRDVRFQFVDFPATVRRFGLDPATRVTHLIVSGSTECGLAARVYALSGGA